MANVNTNFIPKKGVWAFEALPMKASTAMQQGAAIGIEVSGGTTTGNYTLMGVENASGADFKGILQETIASGDADYATAGKLKLVAIPMNAEAVAEFKVSAGTLTSADVGKTVEFHSDSLGLAVDTPGKGARIVKALSAARGECVFPFSATETA